MIDWRIGNNIEVLRTLPECSVNCVVTSPPYAGLRDYGTSTWVGGDPNCKHRARKQFSPPGKTSQMHPKMRRRLSGTDSSTLQGGKETVNSAQEPCKRNVCPHCGAVRTNEVWGGKKGCKHVWGETGCIADGNAPSDKSTLGGKLGGNHKKMRSQPLEAFTGSFCSKCNAWQGELGQEPTLELYIEHLVWVFREVRRVLRDDGTFWCNIGDSYSRNPGKGKSGVGKNSRYLGGCEETGQMVRNIPNGIKEKDLLGVPWLLAFALRNDGWYLRSEIIWNKVNSLPESCTDRPTKIHEQIFLLTKRPQYTFYQDAVREPCVSKPGGACFGKVSATGAALAAGSQARRQTKEDRERYIEKGRNIRSVWTIPTESFPDEHFAPFPQQLVKTCLLAATKKGDTVLDPFGGAGTVSMVAEKMGRNSIYIDLNPKFCELAKRRVLTGQTGGSHRATVGGGFFKG
jgi:DNA modification methylase